MKNAKHLVTGLLSAILIMFSSWASAQASDIGDCRAIGDRLARYACYDNLEAAAGIVVPNSRQQNALEESASEERSLFGRIFDRSPEAVAETEEGAQLVSDASPGVDTFGRKPDTDSAQILEDEDGKSELFDTIASLEQFGPQMWLITLESGQQWRQMAGKRYALEAGEEVRIYPTIWGSSYRLTAPRLAGFIQVKRVD